MAKGYWIARVDIRDPERYKDYVTAAKPAFEKYGAVFLARGGDHTQLEGQARARNVVFTGNVFHGVSQSCVNPLTLQHDQNSPAATWTVDGADYLPFRGEALTVVSVMPEGPLRDNGNAITFAAPYAEVRQGNDADRIALKWPEPLKGRVQVTLRCDRPT